MEAEDGVGNTGGRPGVRERELKKRGEREEKQGERMISCQSSTCSPENTVKWSGAVRMLISNEMRNEPALALRLINGKITPNSSLMK